jgi:hypothetical protein
VEKFLEAVGIAFGCRLEARFCAGIKPLDLPAQRRCRRNADNDVQPFSSTLFENLR